MSYQPGEIHLFDARWASPRGGLAVLAAACASGLGAAGLWLAGQRGLLLAAAAVLFAVVALALARPLMPRAKLLRVGPRGISGWRLNDRTVPWAELHDLQVQWVQGQPQLVLELAPRARSLSTTQRGLFATRSTQRRIGLAALPRGEQARAIRMAREAFHTYGPEDAGTGDHATGDEREALARFKRDLADASGLTWALYAVVLANIGAWLWTLAEGMPAWSPRAADLFSLGANSAYAVRREGEFWRMLTATFLHAGFAHLFFNMLGLWPAGRLLNRLQGNGQFLVIYLGSALAGSAAALNFTAQKAVSVGASGAVFGVLGALLVSVRRHREDMPARWRKSVITTQGLFMAYALLQGFASAGVDNAAHVGGLITGALLAWLFADNLDEEPRSAQRGVRVLVGSLACAAMVAAFVVATPAPQVDHRKRFAAEATLRAAMPTLRQTDEKLRQDALELAAGRLTQAQFAQRLEQVHLPAFRLLERQLAQVDFEPQDPRADFTREFRQLTAKTVQAMELQVGMARGTLSRPTAVRDLAMAQDQINAIMRRLNAQAAQMAESRR